VINVRFFLAVFLLFSFLCRAHADERVGSFQIDQILMRPTLVSHEIEGEEFSLSDSSLTVSWKRDEKIAAYFTLGSELSRYMPIYYNVTPEDKIAFTEAYAQFENAYGRLRFGLIPLNFGYDAVIKSSERYFKRALPYSEGLIGVRDYGISYFTSHRGYYTQLAFHNGEIDSTSDGRLWTSANWGYTNERTWTVQMSLQTGYVKGTISNPSNVIAGVVPGETAKWRNGLFYAHWHPRNWNVVFQAGGGEVDQDQDTGRYYTSMLEATRLFSKNFGAGIRIDEFDPNRNLNDDKITESSLLLLFKSADSTSDFYLLGTKVLEEANEVPNDELRLVWLLTPNSR
jgi:hypothetical protein